MPPRKRRTKAEIERARKRAESQRTYHLRVTHSMTPEQYEELFEYQGGRCYICPRALGRRRKLSIDHDHKVAREQCEHEHDKSCPRCWRGLLCAPCNKLLAHLRDDPVLLRVAALYLEHPPAQGWLADKEWRADYASAHALRSRPNANT